MSDNKKRFEVLTIEKRGDRSFWHRIGTGWENKDGSINVTLVAFPVNGELHIRLPKPKDDSEGSNDRRSR